MSKRSQKQKQKQEAPSLLGGRGRRPWAAMSCGASLGRDAAPGSAAGRLWEKRTVTRVWAACGSVHLLEGLTLSS